MNKHCYRLIFSKVLGFLIPVAETTTAARKAGQTCASSTSAFPPAAWLLKALPLALLGVMPYTQAQIVIPHNSGQMTHSAGGVPVMDINNPNSKGLSHNRLSEFNVANPGLIFNNSLRDGNSQIGGHVIHNPKLTREARAILTEVMGNNASSIEGTLEVFGGRADIFIAKTISTQTDVVNKNTNARHMTSATTGVDLKNVLAKLNSPNKADQASLKANPMTVTTRGADGKLTTHTISDAASLKALHGQQVVTGERSEYVNRGSGLGQSSTVYIQIKPQPGGGFSYSFQSRPPAPLPRAR